MSINHLSASSIDTFQRCQLQWYHRYVLGERQPPSIALVQGGSVHKSAEYEYAYKLEAGEDAPLDECLDVARDTFELEAEQVEDWEGTKPSAVLDETVNLARLYREELAPAVMPVSVERELLISDESWRWPLSATRTGRDWSDRHQDQQGPQEPVGYRLQHPGGHLPARPSPRRTA